LCACAFAIIASSAGILDLASVSCTRGGRGRTRLLRISQARWDLWGSGSKSGLRRVERGIIDHPVLRVAGGGIRLVERRRRRRFWLGWRRGVPSYSPGAFARPVLDVNALKRALRRQVRRRAIDVVKTVGDGFFRCARQFIGRFSARSACDTFRGTRRLVREAQRAGGRNQLLFPHLFVMARATGVRKGIRPSRICARVFCAPILCRVEWFVRYRLRRRRATSCDFGRVFQPHRTSIAALETSVSVPFGRDRNSH